MLRRYLRIRTMLYLYVRTLCMHTHNTAVNVPWHLNDPALPDRIVFPIAHVTSAFVNSHSYI